MPKPTEKQIKAEIAELTKAKTYVPKRTMFGDDNIEAIDAEITVLNERLTEDEVFDRSVNEGDGEDTDESKWPEHTRDIALTAVQWLEGEESEPPSKGWEIFKKKS